MTFNHDSARQWMRTTAEAFYTGATVGVFFGFLDLVIQYLRSVGV